MRGKIYKRVVSALSAFKIVGVALLFLAADSHIEFKKTIVDQKC